MHGQRTTIVSKVHSSMTVAYGKGIWLLTFGTSIALIGIYGLGIDWNTLRTWYSLPRMRTTEHTSYKPTRHDRHISYRCRSRSSLRSTGTTTYYPHSQSDDDHDIPSLSHPFESLLGERRDERRYGHSEA